MEIGCSAVRVGRKGSDPLAERAHYTGGHSARRCPECPKCCLKILNVLCSTTIQSVGVRKPAKAGVESEKNGKLGTGMHQTMKTIVLNDTPKCRNAPVASGFCSAGAVRAVARESTIPELPSFSELPNYENRCGEPVSKMIPQARDKQLTKILTSGRKLRREIFNPAK